MFNAANELAVSLFLNRKIGYLTITEMIEAAMANHRTIENPDVDQILRPSGRRMSSLSERKNGHYHDERKTGESRMSLIAAVLIFGIIILIHEFGHFLFAKLNGIGVIEFSLGMGPRLCSFEKGGTRYSIKILPFGGSCMMLGEDEDNTDQSAFNNKSVWARISVVAAGPLFNFLLALILSMVLIGFTGYDTATVMAGWWTVFRRRRPESRRATWLTRVNGRKRSTPTRM